MATRVSVVMPYYENQRTLVRSLHSFATQSHRPHEIIVVDDGSQHSAESVLGQAGQEGFADVPVRLLRANHGGQSAATNVGIRHARGELTFLSCPDIVAPKETLAMHVAAHTQARAAGSEVGVMGHIVYAPWLKMTPFLRFLSKSGPQFCYDLITDANNAEPAHLYAPACSMPTARLLEVGGFDEVFTYGYQDTDLGLRLAARGLRFVYLAKATVLHDHPNDIDNFCRRNTRIGELTWHLLDKHPHVMPAEQLRPGLRSWGKCYRVLPRVREEAALLEQRLAGGRQATSKQEAAALQQLLEARYDGLLTASFSRGLLRAGEAMRTRLDIPAAEWAQLCAALLGEAGPAQGKVQAAS